MTHGSGIAASMRDQVRKKMSERENLERARDASTKHDNDDDDIGGRGVRLTEESEEVGESSDSKRKREEKEKLKR